ncbi:voltage-dependent chloride channel 2, chloroplastic [Salvia miltiorrhiza]|uniref:voltage-dependent chloride channel 2, chloroplastic n=1 Tax=Salvia miltiorrhiza TaxID=226208 RepID=UPI0025AD8F7B|nr:voltage-dependent chloride channel 2, chloroplastic [Salvia miltiorrhiza]
MSIPHSAKLPSPSPSPSPPKMLSKFPHAPLLNPSTNRSPKSLCACHSTKPSNSPPIRDSALASILLAIPDWADAIKERGMKQRRYLYDHQSWVQHRSSLRHVRHLLTSLSSRVILSLVPPVIAFTSVAVFVAVYNSAVSMDLLPEFFPILRASSLPYQLTAPALALLLVFRTEASYSRFEEGKKTWTKVISGAEDFARQLTANVHAPDDDTLKKAILQYLMAFPVALKCHIINGSDVAQDLNNLLDGDDLAVVLSSKHRPRCIIEFISQSLQLLDIEATKRQIMESKLGCFHEGIGVCEQIMGTPIPLSYTRLTSRFLVLWHLTLPVILWDDCHWIVVPATFISAASLFCIEEVGVLIEEPFPVLALDEMCLRLRSNIDDVMRNEKLIRARVSAKRKRSCGKKQSPNGWPNSLQDRQPG